MGDPQKRTKPYFYTLPDDDTPLNFDAANIAEDEELILTMETVLHDTGASPPIFLNRESEDVKAVILGDPID